MNYKFDTSRARSDSSLLVQGDKYRFTVLTSRLIRMEYSEEGVFTDKATWLAVNRNFERPKFTVSETKDSLEIITKDLHLYYDKESFSKEGLSIHLSGDFTLHGSRWSYGDEVRTLGGTARTLDEADGPIPIEDGLMSTEGFTVLDDSRSEILQEDGFMAPRKEGVTDLYFFGYGRDYKGCLKDFFHLSGEVPMLPRYALGNWWSRYYKYTQKSYLELMDRFDQEGIPISVAVIDMDWHITDVPKEYGSGWTGYTWNKDLFPDPKGFLYELHARNMHTTLNVHPADGVRAFEDAYENIATDMGIDPSTKQKIPFDAANKKFMECYFKDLHHPLEDEGVDFWWIDWQQKNGSSVKGIDTLKMLNHLHFIDNGARNGHPMTFSRFAGIGSHRYPIGFSGDTVATWASLEFQPYFTATATNAGYTWWSHDIGGHMNGEHDDERTLRWIQFGVFSPIMRLHSTSNIFLGKEPWKYAAYVQPAMKEFLKLRNKLIPYLYTMNHLTHTKGMPLIMPMYYMHGDDAAYYVPNEYYFGEDIIVSPIVKPSNPVTKRSEVMTWIPEGTYYDFFTGLVYKGDKKIKLYRDIDSIPVLVKAGSIIPMAGDYKKAHVENPHEMVLNMYHGANGAFTIYEDDAEDPDQKAFTKVEYICDEGNTCRILISVTGDTDVIPKDRRYLIKLNGVNEVVKVTATCGELPFSYDGEKKVLESGIDLDKFADGEIELKVEFKDAGIAQQDIERMLFELLQAACISYNLKQDIYFRFINRNSDTDFLASVFAMNVEPDLYGAIAELVTAL